MMKNLTRTMLATSLLGLLGYQASAQTLYEDFEQTHEVTYPTVMSTLTTEDNPAKSDANNSAKVGKYVRDGGAEYAVIVMNPTDNRMLADVSSYLSGAKTMTMKFYSPAVGVKVQLVLQNKARVGGYPNGNLRGTFDAVTTVANSWETLTFKFNEGGNDANVTPTSIDQIVMLVEPGKKDGATYYFDDFKGPEFAASTPPMATMLLDNFESMRMVTYAFTSGVFDQGFANPAKGTDNNSDQVAKYTRNASEEYDVIVINPSDKQMFADVSGFLSGAQKLTMKFYSPKAGVKVQMVLQDKTKSAKGYPNGNLGGTFEAVTSKVNAWETLTFQFTPGDKDETVTATSIDQIVMLIDYGKKTGDTYYFDDIQGPGFKVTTSARAPRVATATFSAMYPNPANSDARLEFSLRQAGPVTLALYDLTGRRVAIVLQNAARPAGAQQVLVPTASLEAGLYHLRLEAAGHTTSQALSVQH